MSGNYLLSHVAVYLLVKRGDTILLIRRYNTGWKDGMYTLPAGHVDDGETAPTAASREAKEEVHVNVLPEDIRLVHVMQRKSDDRREYIDLFFEAKKWSGVPANNEPHKCDDMRWFDNKQLPEHILENVRAALEHISGGSLFSSFGF